MICFRGCFSVRVSTCLFIFTLCGRIIGALNEPVKVTVMEGNDVILPCSLSTKENIEFEVFDWKKDGQKEVFLYDAGIHYNNGRDGQDKQFERRVSHFSNQLKNGIASIIIRNTKVADSGNYTCFFPRLQPSQTFLIELVVGAASKPLITIIKRDNEVLLQCEVLGVSPKPEVEWKDSSGNTVPAEEPKITERGHRYDVILEAPVTKTDNFRCVVTQKEINHQIENDIDVIHGAASEPFVKTVETKDGMKLQCKVLGVSPKPEVEWKDSSGNIVPAEEPKITERGGSYDIILEAPVTKTDHYWCVVTQKEIYHQTENDISVTIGDSNGWIAFGILLLPLVSVVGGVLYVKSAYEITPKKSRAQQENDSGNPPVVDNEPGNGLRTDPLLPGSDVPEKTSPV